MNFTFGVTIRLVQNQQSQRHAHGNINGINNLLDTKQREANKISQLQQLQNVQQIEPIEQIEQLKHLEQAQKLQQLQELQQFQDGHVQATESLLSILGVQVTKMAIVIGTKTILVISLSSTKNNCNKSSGMNKFDHNSSNKNSDLNINANCKNCTMVNNWLESN